LSQVDTYPAEVASSGDEAVALPRETAGRSSASWRRRLFEGTGWTMLRVVTDSVLLVLGNVAAIVGAPAAQTALDGEELIWLLPPLVIAVLAVRGQYRDRIQVRVLDGLGQVLAITSLSAISLIAAAAVLDPQADAAPLIARAWLLGSVYLLGGRALLAWAQRRARQTRLLAKPTLIVGAGRIGVRVERRLLDQPELGLLPVGYLDADPAPQEMVPDRQGPVLGPPDLAGEVAAATGAQHVVVGFSSAPDRLLQPLVHECEQRGIGISLVPRFFDSVNTHIGLDHVGGLPLFELHSINPKGWEFTVKHVLDRIGAALLLVLVAPVLLTAAALVKLSSPGPVLFRQRRIGRDGRSFRIMKFRSMVHVDEPPDDENVVQLPTDIAPGGVEGYDRRTPVGGLLRRTSIDELPQLFNVLKGDMSLVGPRPERPEYVELFGPRVYRYADRHRVKSGITGWAQVNGLRGKTSLADRVEWDNWYIANWSLWLDVKILFMTVSAVIRHAE
jgi:exopolysaccharide biosynthesis polyprenyl glycosylphosphotransferase